MEKTSTSDRLKEVMKSRNLRQVDILEKAKPYCQKYNVKMNKSDLSQYVSGLVEPGQDKLAVLGMALGVNEAWLMGYDVPMEGSTITEKTIPQNKKQIELSDIELELLHKYRTIDDKGKHTIDTVLEMEYNRCNRKMVEQRWSEESATIETIAAHNDADLTDEELDLMNQDISEL